LYEEQMELELESGSGKPLFDRSEGIQFITDPGAAVGPEETGSFWSCIGRALHLGLGEAFWMCL